MKVLGVIPARYNSTRLPGNTVYFNVSIIPFVRGWEQEQWLDRHVFYKHIGFYAYRQNVLLNITKLKPSALELSEKLEQLGWQENGSKIRINLTKNKFYLFV